MEAGASADSAPAPALTAASLTVARRWKAAGVSVGGWPDKQNAVFPGTGKRLSPQQEGRPGPGTTRTDLGDAVPRAEASPEGTSAARFRSHDVLGIGLCGGGGEPSGGRQGLGGWRGRRGSRQRSAGDTEASCGVTAARQCEHAQCAERNLKMLRTVTFVTHILS